jgi:hypothetical protein
LKYTQLPGQLLNKAPVGGVKLPPLPQSLSSDEPAEIIALSQKNPSAMRFPNKVTVEPLREGVLLLLQVCKVRSSILKRILQKSDKGRAVCAAAEHAKRLLHKKVKTGFIQGMFLS